MQAHVRRSDEFLKFVGSPWVKYVLIPLQPQLTQVHWSATTTISGSTTTRCGFAWWASIITITIPAIHQQCSDTNYVLLHTTTTESNVNWCSPYRSSREAAAFTRTLLVWRQVTLHYNTEGIPPFSSATAAATISCRCWTEFETAAVTTACSMSCRLRGPTTLLSQSTTID